MPKIKDILEAIEVVAPRNLQEDYDNAGIQIGDADKDATSALLCVDVTEDIVDEAIIKKANLIISHHPLLFKGVKTINNQDETGRIIIKAIKNDIVIYSAHTNLDNAYNGVSFDIAKRIGLTEIEILENQEGKFLKLVVFVPSTHAEILRCAIAEAGAGKLGNYDNCSFSSEGIGSFRALNGAHPFVGKQNDIHREPEVREEFLLPVELRNKIISTLIKVHPYEEPAFDIIPLENISKYNGSGVIGNIEPENINDFLNSLKKKFNVGSIKYSKGKTNTVRRVAICGGSGAFLIPKAIQKNADIYITGDVKYHDFTTFGNSLIIADIGHYESEQFTKDIFYNIIRENFPNFVTCYPEKEKNPINYL